MVGVGVACLAAWVWAQPSSTSSADQNGSGSAATSELQQATEVIQHMTTTAPDKAIPQSRGSQMRRGHSEAGERGVCGGRRTWNRRGYLPGQGR